MSISLILQVAGVSILVTAIYTVLKQAGRDEYAFATLLLGIVMVLAMVLPKVADLFNSVKSVFNLY